MGDKWIKAISREYSVQYSEIHHKSLNMHFGPKKIPAMPKWMVSLPESQNEAVYFKEMEFARFNKAIIKKFSSSQKKLNEFLTLFYQSADHYLFTSKKASQLNVERMSSRELGKLYADYFDSAVVYTSYLWVSYLMNEYWSEKGNNLVSGLDEETKSVLLSPIKKSSIIQMHEKAAKLNTKDRKSLFEFRKEYSWISCLDVHKLPWQEKDFEKFIKGIKAGKISRQMHFDLALKNAKMLNHKQDFEIIRTLAYIKDLRDDYRRKSIYYAQYLYFEIARRMGIRETEIAYLTKEEILAFLNDGKISVADIKQRRKGFLLYLDEKKLVLLTKDISRELSKINFKKPKQADALVHGIIANKGKTKGHVKIIRTVHDTRNFRKGSIMVAITTHPDYLPAMQRAKAIVTDEGGITSHAAIVSRELGIPCIVGTKNATHLLKDGDLIEVDANKGIVRKIK